MDYKLQYLTNFTILIYFVIDATRKLHKLGLTMLWDRPDLAYSIITAGGVEGWKVCLNTFCI